MPDIDLRTFVLALLKPVLPKSWRMVPVQKNLDSIDRVTLMLKLSTIERTPSAPQGSRDVDYVLTIIQPKTDPETAWPALDDDLIDLLGAIDDLPSIAWKTATAVTFGDPAAYFAYDITLTTQYIKENS